MEYCKMIENEEKLQCANKHSQNPVITILLDTDFVGAQRLACQQCIQNNLRPFNGISLTQGISKIQQMRSKIYNEILNLFLQNQIKMQSFKNKISQWKEQLLLTIDEIQSNLEIWMQELETLKNSYKQYSLLNEIDKVIIQLDKLIEQEKQQFQQRIQKFKDQYQTKIYKKIDSLQNLIQDQLQNLYEDSIIIKEIPQSSKSFFEQQQRESNQVVINQLNKSDRVEYRLIHEAYQRQFSRALDFNHDNSLMAASSDQNIIIWKFQEGKLNNKETVLTGHKNDVFCIVFSKKMNWIVSGDKNNQIISWIERVNNQGKSQWESFVSVKQHKQFILCLYLNKNEDELISSSADSKIKVWKVECKSNKIEYKYSLSEHKSFVDKVDLNSTETQMVSCGRDKKIILWEKDGNNKWKFKCNVAQSTNDYGLRIGFLQDDTIVQCQYSQPFLQVFKLQNGKFSQCQNLKVQLKEIIAEVSKDSEDPKNDITFFQLKYLEQQKVLVFKSNRYIYFMKQSSNSNLIYSCDPIDCKTFLCYGNITNNGRYLVIWNEKRLGFQVYEIEYR
ncbi:unnamed protein product [Paramecium primaurelia]|uniref:WD40-repeat-containing domain n=1 Tax=Paramecium primaurelia TaxID=5886 RepID=A0A8S1PS40_PARPR|nr:unnamed protein product [Paramecium primaurelia]